MRGRLPYESFVSLSKDLIEHGLFDKWYCKDTAGNEFSDINLVLLGAVRYTIKVWVFNDVDEANVIQEE